jgi:3-hydroxyacyl-CoA dehydrogenase/3a,7a,12a-trihydroxy-5b-cholest-24-enoyl-CoA hydratase
MNSATADLSALAGASFVPTTFSYTERDAILYALGAGAAADPLDPVSLAYTYENAPAGFRVLPTFASTFGYETMWQILGLPGVRLNPMMLLHGEHETRMPGPLPREATLTNHGQLAHVYDKGSGALFLLDVTSEDARGTVVAENRYTLFARGLGGWGGERGPSASDEMPARQPDAAYRQPISPNQALLYRLSGDRNPLHADPAVAALAGYDRPILHGLATYGFAAHALLRHAAAGRVESFRSIRARFSRHVFPGETLAVEIWDEGSGLFRFRCRVLERDEVVLTNGALTLTPAV